MHLILHPNTQKLLTAMGSNIPQALLLTGKPGIGLEAVARSIADATAGYVSLLKPEKNDAIDVKTGTIGVQHIRDLYKSTRSKHDKPFIVVIKMAETMTLPAQNAFLKLLEEPGRSVYFMLLAHDMTKLLPTILSRVQQITIKPITDKQSNQLLNALEVSDEKRRAQILFIARGLPAEITRLTQDDDYFKQRAAVVRDARQLLRASTYEKLCIIQKYKSNRTDALQLLEDIANILKLDLERGNVKISQLTRLDAIMAAHERINANANIRLALALTVL